MDPLGLLRFGTLASFGGLPGGAQAIDVGKTMLQYDPNIASQLALARDPTTLDMLQYARAVQSGNPQLIQAFANKLKTDTGMQHDSMSGIYTRVEPDGSVTTINPTTGLRVNSKTGASYLPGALAAFAAREGAEESARLQAQTNPAPATPKAGPAASAPGPTSSAAPTPRSLGATVAPAAPVPGALPPKFQGAGAMSAENFVPPVLRAPGATAPRAGNTGLAALKEFQEEQSRNAAKLSDGLQEQADNSQQLLTQAQQIEAAARDFTPGRYAQTKGEILAALQPTGLLSDAQLKQLGSYQEGQKLSIQLQALATKQLGSREAAQVFQVMGKSIPNLTLSPDGLAKISAYMQGIARYNIARATFGQRLAAEDNVAGLNSLPQTFQTASNPTFYILASAPASVRQEMVNSIAPAQRQQFALAWDRAIKLGLAPRPQDYEGE